MIVYGDPQYETDLGSLVGQLRAPLARTRHDPAAPPLDALRTLLVLAGQVEQAVLDAGPEVSSPVASAVREMTTCAATAFYHTWAGAAPDRSPVRAALAGMEQALAGIEGEGGTRCTVKVPEGFAFYALYPEQYCAAAERWLRDHAAAEDRAAIVVGIRSIGTTLAALVAATLRAGGWRVHSRTVRPTGHPFARQAALDPAQIGGADWGLVVDEGPGLSGSSMAAVAAALAAAGLPRDRISFFPGHGGDPGGAASDAVRAWWATTPRYVTPHADLRIGGHTLPDALAAGVTALLCGDPVVAVEDLGGGLWRRALYPEATAWPAACAPFERPKYRCTTRSGRQVLCKFEGFAGVPGGPGSGAEVVAATLAARAAAGWGPPPLGIVHGFVVLPWVTGAPGTAADGSPAVLAHVGRYIAEAAGPALDPTAQEAALARLEEMLYWNTWELFDEAAAARTRGLAPAAPPAGPARRYGDGRLAPHEWLRTPAGGLLKTDGAGHVWDHTMVGAQPLAWDVAGALVEWGLDAPAAAPLLAAYQAAGGERLPAPTLAFYRLAYAAFRAGQCVLCAEMSGHDPAEQARLWAARDRYRDLLARET